MGFSWSSYIAQTTMLDVCAEANLTKELVLCDTEPAPHSSRRAFALATDDIMYFNRGSKLASERAMDKVDALFCLT